MNQHLISLPDDLETYIEGMVAAGKAQSVGDYIVQLANRDKVIREQAIADLRSLIEEAEASGISPLSIDEIFAKARKRAKAKVKKVG